MASDVEKRLIKAKKEYEHWHAERIAAVHAAAEAGFNPTQLARMSGLSRVHIYRILKDTQ